MGNEKENINQLISSAERIGTIGSPSSTGELSLDILGTAVKKKLVGELAFFTFLQDGNPNYALGQITEIQLRNIWLEGPTMRSLVRQRGLVNPVSEQQDTHLGQMIISAVFSNESDKFEPSLLGTVPATGTFIKLATDQILDCLLERYRDEIFYLGKVYGSAPKLPLWFKHFGTGPHGAGEAYHIGFFGKTGSGKSVLAMMAIIAYARYSNMGIFILDPQGQFALSLKNKEEISDMIHILNSDVLESFGRKHKIFDLKNLRLDRWEIFTELLREYRFFFKLGIKSFEYQDIVADDIVEFLRKESSIRLDNLDRVALKKVLEYLHKAIEKIYGQKSGIERVKKFIEETLEDLQNDKLSSIISNWEKVSKFFTAGDDKKTPEQIVWQSLYPDDRPIIVIDLSQKPDEVEQHIWDSKIKPLLIDRFIQAITTMAEVAYQKKEQGNLNTLVLIDEAHRLAPREKQANERNEKIKNRLIDATRTTRKYGLGWIFISTTLSSLHREIIGQLRILFFGFGLAFGPEFISLREYVGDPKALKLYQSFRDPHSAFDIESRQYAFMTIGPISPLSFAGTPLFFTAFNTPRDFLKNNRLKREGF